MLILKESPLDSQTGKLHAVWFEIPHEQISRERDTLARVNILTGIFEKCVQKAAGQQDTKLVHTDYTSIKLNNSSSWEGGFRSKQKEDTSVLIAVFNDQATASDFRNAVCQEYCATEGHLDSGIMMRPAT